MPNDADITLDAASQGSDSSSSTLLYLVQAQDPQAWQRLVDLYAPLIYRWCRRCNLQADDAADVAQEVFAAVFANVGQFRKDQPGASFRGWIWTIAQNKIRDHFRRREGRAQAEGGSVARGLLAQVAAAEPDGLDEPIEEDDRKLLAHLGLNAVRARFADSTWQAFWRIAVGGETPANVAADLGLSLRAVYQAKYRVLNTIRRELSDLL
jgi:RNA polymerase sigma-70 factor, ECF subfamily